MAKLILLLVFACFQFSSQEELAQIPDEPTNDIQFPATDMLDGEDKDHWYKGEEDDEDWKDDSFEFSEEDYDDDLEEVEKLIDEIEDWMGKAHPDKSKYQWLFELGKWFDDEYDDDDYAQYPDINKEENLDVVVDDNNNMDLYYSWLYKLQLGKSKAKRSKPFKRFWSV